MRNKFLIIVIVLLSITLISCKKKETQPLAENEYNIYYLNTNNKLMEVQDAMRELKPLLPVYEGTKHRELIIIAYNRLA